MKVLQVSSPLSWRGGEQQAAYLTLALHQAGIETVVLCPEGSVLSEKMKVKAIPVITFRSRGAFNLQLARKISDICRSESIDIIHTHDSHAHSGAVTSALIFGISQPIVVSRRVDFAVSENPFSKWKYNHKSVKKIICVSHAIQDITAPSIKDKSKLCVIHSGTDTGSYDFPLHENPLRKELSIDMGDKIIGNFSALADHKDYPLFLETARALLQRGLAAHFVIAGKGPEEGSIRSFIEKHGLSERIHLLGFRKDIPMLMKSLDLFLITSKTEGLGTIILEAFAGGIPVVATRAGGIPELVENGSTGLLADVGDSEGLQKAVFRIFEEPGLKERIVNNAALKVQEFSFRATAQKTIGIYKQVLNL